MRLKVGTAIAISAAMMLANLEREAALAEEQLARAEADAETARRRFDQALCRRARSAKTQARREELSREYRDAELRAAALRREVEATRTALEWVAAAKALAHA